MASNFSNEPLPLEHVPRLAAEHFVPVDRRYLGVTLVGFGLVGAIVLVGASLIASQVERPAIALAIAFGVVIVLVVAAVLRTIEVRRLGYQLRDHDLSLRSGVVTHSIQSVPFSRVQHVSVSRGPVERSFGLATLQVSSAGPNVSIPGLAIDDAERIKALITARADIEADDRDTPLPPPVR